MWVHRLTSVCLAASVCLSAAHSLRADEDFFRKQVAPILERHCVRCHAGDEPKGGLSLETRAAVLAGGDSGPALVAGEPADSYLLEVITGEKPQMPKGAPPLSAVQRQVLEKWIRDGASWPDGLTLQDRQFEGETWWSLQPLQRPAVPRNTPLADGTPWEHNTIDAFIRQGHLRHGLAPAPAADRRTLIRRVTFDLTGLPPTPEEIDRFLNDPDPRAYEALVERLLESPRYGERWARHWLDVVHYGDTHGYDKDKPRPHAWPYRDYVIRALNEDKPYSRFVQEQIAGDILFPGTVDGIEALGFIAAGPWDFIGHAEVPESKTDGMIARHLDRDDMIGNTIGTFNSLTVQCAQCHNHKFDPIPQADYYRLQAVFAALDRADKAYDLHPETTLKRQELATQQRDLTEKLKALEMRVAEQAGPELVVLDQRLAAAREPANSALAQQFGYHSQIEATADVVKWVQVDLGKSVPVAGIQVVGCHDDFNQIGAGFGFPVRFRIEVSDDATFRENVRVIHDQTAADFRNPGVKPLQYPADGAAARYVRVTATRLAPRMNDYIFALAELTVLNDALQPILAESKVTALDSIEAPPRWRQSNLTDGYYYGKPQASEAEIAALQSERERMLADKVPAALREELASTRRQLDAAQVAVKALPSPRYVFAGTIHHGTGAFTGTGPNGGKPRTIHVLHRGDVKQPREEVTPAGLSAIPGLSAEFQLPADHPEGARRAALAHWITSPQNPLTWRSIVNRVWQYHFGRGLVETPNDFGRMGALPSHPELLDWLAVEFRDGGQSLKQLHRLIVCSATYRQASRAPDGTQFAAIDADNRWLWRMNRRKLEAEAIHDAALFLSGKLNPQMYGPGFQDFLIEKPEHSPHYEYTKFDPHDPACHRRSIYRFIVRSQQQPFMTTLDCADPSQRVDRRNESLSALQALTLLNNDFMVTMEQYFAESLSKDGEDVQAQVTRAFQRALGRPPSVAEQTALTAYSQKHGLANLCRLLLNLNEFAFID